MDEEEEDISQNTGETDEPTETEENAGEETEVQNIEDDKSEADKPDVVENEGDVDQIGDIEEFMEEQEFRRHDIENEEFLLLETCQITFEEEQKQRELMKEMEIAEKAEALGDEDEKREQDDEEQKSEASGEQMGDKESIFTKGRGSIFYEIGPRIRDLEDNQLFIGDFLLKEDNVPLKFYKLMDGKEEEECEEESKPEEEEITIDRVPYYEKHENIMAEITRERVKNNILQKKLAKFFKRRKMDHVLKETEQQFDTQEKYGKKLNAFGELSKLDYDQRTTITNELENLRTERENKFYELNKIFNDLQLQEKDTGYGLIHTKTGKPIPDKLIERLLNRQKHQMQTVGDMRLIYIQLKNMVAEKQNAISQIDKIGDNLYLMDFEQLKVENRSYMDKMEEKDEELSRLRNKCQKTIQILAHMREKSAALENDICDMTDDLQNLNQNSIAVRGNLNKLKQQRDHYRNMKNKLRDESGLLVESELLRDMEISMEQLKSMTKELESLKEEHKIKAQQIRNIRKNIEYLPERFTKKPQKLVSDKIPHGKRLYKGRPSLHQPTLPEDAFNHLKNFRGRPNFNKSKKKSTDV